MNAIDLLKQDHRVVDSLFSKAEDAPPAEQQALFKRIYGELTTHAHVEEKIFYPALKKAGDKELVDIVLEGFEEHLQMKMFLEQLKGMSSKKEVFQPKLTVLIEDTRHHVKEEEREMFQMAEDQLGQETLEKLGQKMEAEKKKYQKANGIKPEDPAEHQGTLATIVTKAVEAVSGVFMAPDKGKSKTTRSKANATATAKSSTTKTKAASTKTSSAKSTPAKTKGGSAAARSAKAGGSK